MSLLVTFPTIRRPSSARWRPIYNVLIHQSRFSRSISTAEFPGRSFYGEWFWENLSETEMADIEAWVGKMKGSAGRMYMSPPHRLTPLGAALTMSGAYIPRINGAGQTGVSIVTDGWVPSTSTLLRAGDYIAFDNGNGGRELKLVVDAASSNGSGQMTITVDDPIRSSPPDNNLILFNPATALMVPYDANSEDGGIEFEPPMLGSWKLSAIEV
jgi:hypothetical protein